MITLGKISTYPRHRGIKKSEVKVTVSTPSGKEYTVLKAEVEKCAPDKRKKFSFRYVTLASLSRTPRLDLTLNLDTLKLSITGHHGFHYFYTVLDSDRFVKMMAAILLTLRSRGTSSNLLEGLLTDKENLGVGFYIQDFKEKIANMTRARQSIESQKKWRGIDRRNMKRKIPQDKRIAQVKK